MKKYATVKTGSPPVVTICNGMVTTDLPPDNGMAIKFTIKA